MKFHLFRLSLIERAQQPLFDAPSPAGGGAFTRETWMRHVFRDPFTFTHHKQTFHFVPADDLVSTDSPLIVARLGKATVAHENEPPERGLKDTAHDAWKAALFILDPRHHDDGQKLAIEHDSAVGGPQAVIKSLIDFVNRSNDAGPFHIEYGAITDETGFWEFVAENKGAVTRVTFEFHAPNMFGDPDELGNELRKMKEEERVQTVKATLESTDGMNLETERIENAVKVASRGTGSISAHTATGKHFNSKNRATKVKIEGTKADPESTIDLIVRVASSIFRL